MVLKWGGQVMTVDAVNTDSFDDNKVTGIVCVWFIGRAFSAPGSHRMRSNPHVARPLQENERPL